MLSKNPIYKRSVLTPDFVNPYQTKKEIYARQFQEAESITDFFRLKTPVQILADDVGTGKTWVGMMTLFSCLTDDVEDKSATRKGTKRIKRKHALVVAPTRMVANKWIRELYQFNRNFIENPENTSIDQLNSTKKLLEILEADKRSTVPKAHSTLAALFKCNGEERKRSPQGPQLLLLRLLEAYAAQTKTTKENEDKNIQDQKFSFFVEKFSNHSLKGPLDSILLLQNIIHLIEKLKLYNCKCRNNLSYWHDQDFDSIVWNTSNKSRNYINSYWEKSLDEFIPVDEIGLNSRQFKTKLNYLVQIVSVLWSSDRRILDIPPEAVFKQKPDISLHNIINTAFKKKFADYTIEDVNSVFKALITTIIQGLPRESLFKNLNIELSEITQQWGINLKKSYVCEDQAKHIVRMLAAYANRLQSLSGFNIKISDQFMERYAAAGVFKSPIDLHDQISNDTVNNKVESHWLQFINFISPFIEEAKRNYISQKTDSSKHHLKKQQMKFGLMVKRLGSAVLQLIDYEQHPDRVGSSFWFERPKERAIHVMYMNDLKVNAHEKKYQKKDNTNKLTNGEILYKNSIDQLASKLKNSKLIKLAIIDEAHNWRNRAFGARSFQQYIQPSVFRTLLVTATPLHMGVADLKSIIDLSIGLEKNKTTNADKQKSIFKENEFKEFRKSYNALFMSRKDDAVNEELLLSKASELQNEVAKACRALSRNDKAIQIIEKEKHKLAAIPHDKNLKSIQKDIWRKLKDIDKKELSELSELAKSITTLVAFQETNILKHLMLMIVKTRAPKHLQDQNGQRIGRRRYLCGAEVCLNPRPPADEQHLILHDNKGIDNKASGWVELIGMRLSQMDINIDNKQKNKKSARLLVGLPSSYDALRESALFKDVKELESESNDILCPETTKLYCNIFANLTGYSSTHHPKVRQTVDIMFDNLKKGEKSLVFCQRTATVDAIVNAFQARLNNIIKDDLEKITPLDSKSEINTEDIFKIACYHAKKIAKHIDFTSYLSEQKFDDLFECIRHLSTNKNIEAINYDSRVVWLVSEIFNKLVDGFKENKQLQLKRHFRLLELDEDSAKFLYGIQNVDGMENDDKTQKIQNASAILKRLKNAINAGFAVTAKVTGDTDNKDEIRANFSSPFYPLALVCSPVSQEGVDMHKYCRSIVLHDLNWNPAVLEQRVGRLDRVGSYASELGLPVDVFIPYLADSYDEHQYARVLQRAEMQELIFGRNDSVISDKGWDDIKDSESRKQFASQLSDELDDDDQNIPLLGDLIYGLFDMDLSISKRTETYNQQISTQNVSFDT